MQPADQEQFYNVMTGVFELYGKKASPELLELYFGALTEYDLSDVVRALNRHAVDPDAGQFCPKPADVVRLIGGSKQTRALQAWSRVERAAREIGPYQSVVFDDPIIHAVLEDMGGWIDLCGISSEKDLEFRGHEFAKRYQGYALQGGAQRYQSHMTGLIEADCNTKKLPAPKPMLIGDEGRALRVLRTGGAGREQLAKPLDQVLASLPAPDEAKGADLIDLTNDALMEIEVERNQPTVDAGFVAVAR